MAMKFDVEKKGERFLVVNQSTGEVKGNFKDEAEAKTAASSFQKSHDQGVEMVSARITPAPSGESA
jgi:hypothetical protein